MFEASLNQFDIAVLSALRGYQIAPFILYQYKVPRLIRFMDRFFNFDNGRYENFLYRWTNIMWLFILSLLLIGVYGILKCKNFV